jgi:uncharacterized protein YndB with AHSA1/START domain
MAARENRERTARNETTVELQSDRELIITRCFDAPVRMVFEAWTSAELVRRWWAPRSHGVTMAGCEADVRVGGKYRYVLRNSEGGEIAFSGEYREIQPPTRLVYTQVFEPMAGAGAVVVTVTFEETGGKTRMISHERYPSKQARDGALASGMEHGLRETLDQLEELVAALGQG